MHWPRLTRSQFFGAIISVYIFPLAFIHFFVDLLAPHLDPQLPDWFEPSILGIYLLKGMAFDIGLQLLHICLVNYWLWRHRPDFQVGWRTLLAWPFLHYFLNVCEVVGHTLALVYWIPFVPTRVWAFTHRLVNNDEEAAGTGAAKLNGAPHASLKYQQLEASNGVNGYHHHEGTNGAANGVAGNGVANGGTRLGGGGGSSKVLLSLASVGAAFVLVLFVVVPPVAPALRNLVRRSKASNTDVAE